LKLKYDDLRSKLAFKCNLRRFKKVYQASMARQKVAAAALAAAEAKAGTVFL
jgi:hypothetical protein